MTFEDRLKKVQDYELVIPENAIKKDKENILLYTHTLKMGGAPIVLLELAEVLKEKYNVFVVSAEDGMLRDAFYSKGMVLIIGDSQDDKLVEIFRDNIKFIVANTMLSIFFICKFLACNVPVYWWLHEAAEQYEPRKEQSNYYKIVAQKTNLYAAGRRAQKLFYEFCRVKPKVLEFGIADVYDSSKEVEHEKIRFICPSTIQYIKGQDILMGVIQLLPLEYLEKSEFIFLGDKESSNPLFYNELERLAKEYDNVKLMPLMPKEELYKLYYEVDCVIAPSRDDCTPATIVEGMMYHKLNICSDGTGVSMYMTDGVDGFVFRNGDILHALEKVMYVIENFDELSEVREAGRMLYENVYSDEVFVKNVWEMEK